MKLIICAVIVAAGYILGGTAAESRRRAYAQTRGVLRLLGALRTGIDYSRADLASIINAFSDPALEECGFLAALGTMSAPAQKAWELACASLSPGVPMIVEITALGREIGMSGAETQIELISKLELRLEQSAETLRRELDTKSASYRTLGALAGCMAAIILY